MRFAAAALLLTALLIGCGDGDSSTDAGSAPGLELTYHRTGGVAGTDEVLRIHRDGSASVEFGQLIGNAEPTNSGVVKFELAPGETERLRAALADSGFNQIHLDRGSGCADCFIYELATPANQARFDDVTAPAELKPVLARLEAIIDAHRPAG